MRRPRTRDTVVQGRVIRKAVRAYLLADKECQGRGCLLLDKGCHLDRVCHLVLVCPWALGESCLPTGTVPIKACPIPTTRTGLLNSTMAVPLLSSMALVLAVSYPHSVVRATTACPRRRILQVVDRCTGTDRLLLPKEVRGRECSPRTHHPRGRRRMVTVAGCASRRPRARWARSTTAGKTVPFRRCQRIPMGCSHRIGHSFLAQSRRAHCRAT